MLLACRLDVLVPRDLNLDIGSVLHGSLLLQVSLPRRRIEVLCRLIGDLVRGGATDGRQLDVLRGAASRGARPTLRGVVPVPLHAFNQLASLRINLPERVHRVVVLPALVAVAGTRDSLNKSPVSVATLGGSWHVVQVRLPSAPLVASVLQLRRLPLETSIDRRIHARVVQGAGHGSRYVVHSLVV